MQTKKENQEKVLELISKTMTQMEGEYFKLKKIHLYSPYYTLVGNKWDKGTVLILASDKYMNGIINTSFKSNYETHPDASVFAFDGDFSWFKYDNYDEYKSVIFNVSETKDYYEFKSLIGESYLKFPYLDRATSFIDEVKSDIEFNNLITDEFIESTIKSIRKHEKEEVDKEILAKNLIKRLNKINYSR